MPATTTTKANAQLMFDWDIGHALPWLHAAEVAKKLHCSDDHIWNLILDGSIDAAIDIRGVGAKRPCLRILRDSFFRFLNDRADGGRAQAPETPFKQLVGDYLATQRTVFTSHEIARHLRCTDDHILNLRSELAIDISSAGAQRCYPRTSREQLIRFIISRRIT